MSTSIRNITQDLKSLKINTSKSKPIKHWLIRIGDGINFNNSLSNSLWGFNNNNNCSKSFIKNATTNDILWFVTANSKGHIIGFATYQSLNTKDDEPIFNNNQTNGWNQYKDYSNNWNIIIHFINYRSISTDNVLSHIKGNAPIRLYKQNLCINLNDIYNMYNQ
jgi:hypothetical protein